MSSILSLRQYSHDLIAHSHDHAQMVFGLIGQLDFEVAGHGSQVIRQSLVVVPGATHHACGSPSGSQCLVLDVPPTEWLQHTLGPHADSSRRLLEKPAALTLSPAQNQLVNWLAASPINDPVIAQQGAALLLASLATDCHSAGESQRLPLAALDTYIDQHAAHPLQVADLARLTGLSSARFHARFLSETGQTPMDYVRSRRLQQGLELLRGTQLAVGEIAAQVGYSSQSAFTAALAREFGATPRTLRRESRDNSR
ncbi:AraC family transcriptional regulator [Pseudomonas cavernicola]|uniref:AraC family transcriptional regulator n=1 Tax=Pseudomonas cavernicola TaxID=2320866 RepID=A0A418XN14_9PSED|nr:AraC family transcriptional regulator [Pseudomonas cavernicola]RJG13859.1 AraC family transcriptional regulator [Pseudomonas cavernicola]